MTEQNEYERMGRFIYIAFLHGGDMSDVQTWMSNDLNEAHLAAEDTPAENALYKKFFEKYVDEVAFETNFRCFLESIKHRNA